MIPPNFFEKFETSLLKYCSTMSVEAIVSTLLRRSLLIMTDTSMTSMLLKCGVPQDSVLDLILFSHFINDIASLGLLSTALSSDNHILASYKRNSTSCFALRSVANLTSSKTVYFALFVSNLRTAIPFWGTYCTIQIDLIFNYIQQD